jgi:hypothetical protein
LFVRVGHRGEGISHALVDAAASLAQGHGATALEAWPSSREASTEAFLGREGLFTELGFHCVARPTPDRAIMRINFTERTGSSQ